MTDAQVLEVLQKEALLTTGGKIKVHLELDHPPLSVSDGSGHWNLVSWTKYLRREWVFEYQYKANAMYCVVIQNAGNKWVEVRGTRSWNREETEKSAATMNAATVTKKQNWPFNTKRCTD